MGEGTLPTLSATPRVSIVMPVYNGARYLRVAVDSILSQTFDDFEFIIIDDGSMDTTRTILKSYRDKRIVLLDRRHQGLVACLNEGLAAARGEYIARMDCDDIACSERLEKQVRFLDSYPDIGIVGTACQVINSWGWKVETLCFPVTDEEIRWFLLLHNAFAHPSIMLRRGLLETYKLRYDEGWTAVEDYELWTRLLKYTRGANLQQPLLRYRRHAFGVSNTEGSVQVSNHDKLAFRTIKEQLAEMPISQEQVTQLRRLFVRGSEFLPGLNEERVKLATLYLELFLAFAKRHADKTGIKAIQRHVVPRIAGAILRPPFYPGWALFKRLAAIDTNFIRNLADYILFGIGRQVKRYVLGILSA